MSRVAVIHPWLPHYRVQFFADLAAQLATEDIELSVLHGDPPLGVRARGDASGLDWACRLPSRQLRLGSRELTLKRLPPDLRSCDLVIVEQAIRNLETYELLARSTVSGRRLALWGHGRTYTRPHSALHEGLKQFLTRRGSWFFSYTSGGARHVVRHGFDPDRVTVVNNSLDTRELSRRVEETTPAEARQAAAELAVNPASTCLFVGGLDESKRLEFLLAAGERISRAIPDFALLVAGDGTQRALVERAAESTRWLRYVGRADAVVKARLAAVSRLMLMPGAIGLVAVDSFVLGTPVVTTAWPLHGPESEYLQPDWNAVITPDDSRTYADTVAELLRQPALLDTLRSRCWEAAADHTLEQMVQNFAGGVRAALVT